MCPIIVPCYKRVFVAECHNRYSEFLRQGSLHTMYAVGFGRGKTGGRVGAERAISMSREVVAVL